MGAYWCAVDRVVLRKMGVNKFLEDPSNMRFVRAVMKNLFVNTTFFLTISCRSIRVAVVMVAVVSNHCVR